MNRSESMAVSKLEKGTEVECVKHDGKHQGRVVHDLQFAYAVAWRGYRSPVDVDAELIQAHRDDFIYIEYDQVRAV